VKDTNLPTDSPSFKIKLGTKFKTKLIVLLTLFVLSFCLFGIKTDEINGKIVNAIIRDKAKETITVIGKSLIKSPRIPDINTNGTKTNNVVIVPDISANPISLIAFITASLPLRPFLL
jgi:hypothetical protein